MNILNYWGMYIPGLVILGVGAYLTTHNFVLTGSWIAFGGVLLCLLVQTDELHHKGGKRK